MFLWLGGGLSGQWVHDVFGVQSVAQVNTENNILPKLQTEASKRLHRIIDRLQAERPRCMKVIFEKKNIIIFSKSFFFRCCLSNLFSLSKSYFQDGFLFIYFKNDASQHQLIESWNFIRFLNSMPFSMYPLIIQLIDSQPCS